MIRHGETDWNAAGILQGREDIPLNATGRQQAFELADYLKPEQWDVIFSSPLQRAYETALIISDKLAISEVYMENDLIERDYGLASGLLPSERQLRFGNGNIPGLEEFDVLCSRAMEVLNKLVMQHPGMKILAVSHGALINAMLYAVSNGEYGSFKTRLKNGSVNLFLHVQNNWTVAYFNRTIPAP